VILAVTSTILNAWINEQPPLAQVEPVTGERVPNQRLANPGQPKDI